MFSYRNGDEITFYIKPRVARSMISWSKLVAIMLLISSAVLCVTVIGIPVGVFGIISSVKLLQAGSELDTYMKTGKLAYSKNAGECFYTHFRKFMAYYIASFVLVGVMILASAVLAVVFWEDIYVYIQEFVGDYWEFFEEYYGDILPSTSPSQPTSTPSGGLQMVISQIRNLFHGA